MKRVKRVSMIVAAALAVLASVSAGLVAGSDEPLTLSISGRSSGTPSVGARGAFVAVAWGATLDGKTDVFLAVSRDGGATFGAPVQVNTVAGEARLGGELPPRVALTSRHGVSDPDIAVVWTTRGDRTEIKTARSADGGRTFSAPVALQAADATGMRGWPALAFDAGGTAHAIWLDHRGAAMQHGTNASPGRHQHGAAEDGAARAQKSSAYYAAIDGTAVREHELAKGVCYCCKTALAAGPKGALYAAWRHVYPGNLRDMAFSASHDGGRTFSTPVRISKDGWVLDGCPDDGPAMAVDARGTVHVVWPTVVGGDEPEGELFYASSADGRRFTPRVRIPTLGSLKPGHPQIAIDARGRVIIAWDEIVEGRRVAAVRELRGPRGTGAPGPVVDLSPDASAIYPVLAVTETGIVTAWTTVGEPTVVRVRQVTLP